MRSAHVSTGALLRSAGGEAVRAGVGFRSAPSRLGAEWTQGSPSGNGGAERQQAGRNRRRQGPAAKPSSARQPGGGDQRSTCSGHRRGREPILREAYRKHQGRAVGSRKEPGDRSPQGTRETCPSAAPWRPVVGLQDPRRVPAAWVSAAGFASCWELRPSPGLSSLRLS